MSAIRLDASKQYYATSLVLWLDMPCVQHFAVINKSFILDYYWEYVDVHCWIEWVTLFNPVAFVAVSLSCVFGLLISFFGFAARKAITATAFTVTGVVNKFLTVAINQSVTGVNSAPPQRDSAVSKQDDKNDLDNYGDSDEEKGISVGWLGLRPKGFGALVAIAKCRCSRHCQREEAQCEREGQPGQILINVSP
ncbi:hypothetical protein HAX54_038883 [Datura stramonium]|uniref:Uncharacterized protein n=1 Tax=Datura stramonium TaxID=4076 RepID=A0ABS8VNG0_DATST|nr:hypothetical protein [Datura stramonium]